MNPIEAIRQSLPDFARDLRLNLATLLGSGGLPELSADQLWGSALAAAFAARNQRLLAAIEAEAMSKIDVATLDAARLAAAIMAMTNIYYRAVHMVDDPDLSRLPAGLRMNGLAKHGIAPGDFELFELAASAVNGCAGCSKAHVAGARKHGVGTQAIQAVMRLAAVLHATASVLDSMSVTPPADHPGTRSQPTTLIGAT
jgi:lipoyl-dependent peroxiredoxin subunit D